MTEIGNHYLANPTAITVAGRNHQRMLKFAGEKYDENQDICIGAKYLP